MRGQLDSLHQELEMGDKFPIQLLKEKIKVCSNQCNVAFHKLRKERQNIVDQITVLQVEKKQLEEKLQEGEHYMFYGISIKDSS